MWTTDIITPEAAKTLSGLFCERVRRTPHATAYRYFDTTANAWKDSSWAETAAEVARWQAAFAQESLQPGDRVAVMLRNCREWVLFDQAALGSGLVVVPLAPEDRAENAAYLLEEVAAKLLVIEGEEQWQHLSHVCERLPSLVRIVSLQPVMRHKPRLRSLESWLPQRLPGTGVRGVETDPHALATLIYTSGTTGPPKGVMLSHHNILWNAYASLNGITIFREDLLLSILPLFHALERTAGYYLPMMAGATVAFVRAPSLVKEDLIAVRPTVLIAVPRLFERAYAGIQTELQKRPKAIRRLVGLTVALGWRRFQYVQGRGRWHPLLWPLLRRLIAARILAKFGGRLRLSICGGAPLSPALARQFISLGLTLLQGYGLTEASPVVSANLLQDNDPASVGRPLRDVQVRLGEQGELLVKSPGVMRGSIGAIPARPRTPSTRRAGCTPATRPTLRTAISISLAASRTSSPSRPERRCLRQTLRRRLPWIRSSSRSWSWASHAHTWVHWPC
jgi:long-chain acyl-CoA synthetase